MGVLMGVLMRMLVFIAVPVALILVLLRAVILILVQTRSLNGLLSCCSEVSLASAFKCLC